MNFSVIELEDKVIKKFKREDKVVSVPKLCKNINPEFYIKSMVDNLIVKQLNI